MEEWRERLALVSLNEAVDLCCIVLCLYLAIDCVSSQSVKGNI
jgi:hypothetical protein